MLKRREWLGLSGAAPLAARPARPLVCIFSKHLQWTDWAGAASTAHALGFDGVDLTVRAGGHVLPERVREDLPKAVAAVRAAGLEPPMITAGIVDASSPHAEAILETAAGLGIRCYRWGGFRYDLGRGIADQLAELSPRVKALAALNRKYKMTAMYHTHSGPGQVGASIWDIWELVRDCDPAEVAINYDIGHATVEGGHGGWIHTSRLAARYLRGTAVKDFRWGQNAKGEWSPQWCGLGQGMVNFRKYFGLLRETGFNGPLQVHFEYPEAGSAAVGKSTLDLPRERLLTLMRRDLEVLRGLLRESGLG
jgi:L-ribulose-5-phosphate 3-epimerase